MPLKVADRVKEYTTTSGIGGVSFIGAYNGFQRFDDALTCGDTTYYVIEENDKWEVGVGTYGSNNLERDTILASSNNGSKISLGGSGTVSIVYPADKAVFIDDLIVVSGVSNYASGQAVINQDDIVAVSGLIGTADFLPGGSGALIDQNTDQISSVSGWAQAYVDEQDHNATAVSGWADSKFTDSANDLSSVSGWTQVGIDGVVSDLASVSGWTQAGVDSVVSDLANVSGWTQTGLDSASSDLASVSGWTQAGVDAVVSDLANVSGWTSSNFTQTNLDVDYVSGIATYASGQAIQNESDIAAVSGLIGVADFLPGATGALIDQNTDDIATASGALRNSINTNAADIVTASGALRDSINANTTDIATASGALRDSINENILDIASVSGLLTPSGDHFTFSNAILTYFNSAGGSFDVDLSSISGDVYAMIVDGAPTTLDTLNEIAAALNDDANIANTLTNLISSTSGNLQSQITDNVNDLSSTSGYFETRVDDADAEILAVSGWSGAYADAGDTAVSGWSESTFATLLQMDYVSGVAAYSSGQAIDNEVDIVAVSGIAAYASGNTVNGDPSGIPFFGDDGAITGNNTLIYDGQSITLDGTIFATGERVITSDEIFHIKQLTQTEYDALTPDSATFYIITDASEDAAVSGYFQGEVDSLSEDIVAVSGIAAYASGNTISGEASGILYFDNTGSVTGDNTLTYNGADVALSGNIIASGKRVITSEQVYHIEKLTQAEYDAITPDAATFYIITDPDVEGPVVQPYREVSSNTTILSTDYTINATAGLVLTLPTAVGNGGLMYHIKNTSTGNVIVSGVGGETLDGQLSFEMSTQYQSIKVQSTNSNWIIL